MRLGFKSRNPNISGNSSSVNFTFQVNHQNNLKQRSGLKLRFFPDDCKSFYLDTRAIPCNMSSTYLWASHEHNWANDSGNSLWYTSALDDKHVSRTKYAHKLTFYCTSFYWKQMGKLCPFLCVCVFCLFWFLVFAHGNLFLDY